MKNVFVVLFSILIIASGMLIGIHYNGVDIYTFKLKGYSFALAGMFFYFHSIFFKNKGEYYLSSVVIFSGFLYSFYILLFNLNNIKLDLGVYLYLITFILFCISFFLKEDDDEIEEIIEEETEEDRKYEKDILFILGEYLSGIESFDEIENGVCAITYDDSYEGLLISIPKDEKIINYSIKREDIKSINVKKKKAKEKEKEELKDNVIPSKILVMALSGNIGPVVGKNDVFKEVNSYNKIVNGEIYEIVIKYREKDKRIVINTTKSPREFFYKYRELYHEKSTKNLE